MTTRTPIKLTQGERLKLVKESTALLVELNNMMSKQFEVILAELCTLENFDGDGRFFDAIEDEVEMGEKKIVEKARLEARVVTENSKKFVEDGLEMKHLEKTTERGMPRPHTNLIVTQHRFYPIDWDKPPIFDESQEEVITLKFIDSFWQEFENRPSTVIYKFLGNTNSASHRLFGNKIVCRSTGKIISSPSWQVFVGARLHVTGGALRGGRAIDGEVLDTAAGVWLDRNGIVTSSKSKASVEFDAPLELMRRCRHASASVGVRIYIYGGLKGGSIS
ncbi:hypothetical protein GIB67_006783 [Kingdonia uniflora]|uniref:Uncharacterized protein n=1 Tax=Kingdonia uniflora TaxID=39325 RepID=A0A7J7KZU3_9MAGN|nr:hypothetical protein GIB67_006783 [Kingdonia uniflora]